MSEKGQAKSKLLVCNNINKHFPGVKALDNVTLDVTRGEVHVLLGENGAGKSTLMKIFAGAFKKDSGEIFFKGNKVEIHDTKHAKTLGISIIYQELNLIPQLSITENLFLGEELSLFPGKLNWRKMHSTTKSIMKSLGININPRVKVGTFGIAVQQMIEVAKAIHTKTDLLIMDEPTATLCNKEVDELFELINKLRQQNIGIIYISHRLEEVKRIGDRATVLRDGKYIGTVSLSDTTTDKLIEMMVGRRLDNKFPKHDVSIGKEILRVEDLGTEKFLKKINFSLNSGEILGFAGLVGAGRTELAQAIFGIDRINTGSIFIDNKKVKIKKPHDAVENGIGFLTEDRKSQGLILEHSVKNNITLATLKKYIKGGRIIRRIENEAAKKHVSNLSIKTPSLEQLVCNLSGGNQQKVVLSRWLEAKPRILIFDEPTRGIDVGAKIEIYEIMGQLAKEGIGIIMISSELEEIIGISDRIIVMAEGRIKGELSRSEATQEKILLLATPEGMENE